MEKSDLRRIEFQADTEVVITILYTDIIRDAAVGYF